MNIGDKAILISGCGPKYDRIGIVTGFAKRGAVVFVDVNGFEEAAPADRVAVVPYDFDGEAQSNLLAAVKRGP